MSVARKRAQHKVERQRNRSYKLGADLPAYPSPDDPPAPGLVQDRHLD